MMSETLLEKISDSIEQLGKTFDHIHKVPSSLREKYFNQIQTLKDKLIHLKHNLKQSNLTATEKQYRTIYLALHKLKNEINAQTNLSMSKQNRDYNRLNMRQTRKNHDDAMKLIVQKDEKIQALNKALFQKEQLIKLNYQELRQIKRSFQNLQQQYNFCKAHINQLEIQYSTTKTLLIQSQGFVLDLKLREQQKERCFREALQELQLIKTDYLQAVDRNSYFQQLADVNMKKAKNVEENIRKIQAQALIFKENFHKKQGQIMRKTKELQAIQGLLKDHQELNDDLSYKNKRQQQIIGQLQKQISNLHKILNQNKIISQQEKVYQQQSQNVIKEQLQRSLRAIQEKESIINDLHQRLNKQSKQKQQYEKQLKILRSQLSQSQQKTQEYLMELLKLKNEQDSTSHQLKLIQQDRQKHAILLQKTTLLAKQLESQLNSYQQRLKNKQEEKARLAIQLQKLSRELKKIERQIVLAHKTTQSSQRMALQLKTTIVMLEQRVKHRQKDLQNLQSRLLRAKIQLLHQLRQQIS